MARRVFRTSGPLRSCAHDDDSRRAFQLISDIPTRLGVLSDDLDGMRKCRANVRTREALGRTFAKTTDICCPILSRTPRTAYGAHINNAMLAGSLIHFGVRI